MTMPVVNATGVGHAAVNDVAPDAIAKHFFGVTVPSPGNVVESNTMIHHAAAESVESAETSSEYRLPGAALTI